MAACVTLGAGLLIYSQPHLIGTWLIGSSGSDQDFTPDNHCYDSLLVCHNNGLSGEKS